LGELHGFAQWYERFGVLGLSESLVKEALGHASSLLLKVEQLTEAILEEQANFTCLLVWLHKGTAWCWLGAGSCHEIDE